MISSAIVKLTLFECVVLKGVGSNKGEKEISVNPSNTVALRPV